MLYKVPDRVRENASTDISNIDRYREIYASAVNDPDGFWLARSRERILWRKEPKIGLLGDFDSVGDHQLAWFGDGRLNITESCLDRHLETQPDKTAILWEGDEPGDQRRLSYTELHREVCKAANALLELGVHKGDRVIIYMGMVPETAIAMLACARIGAIHSVVFGGFSAEALRDRIRDCGAELIITQDEGLRGGKKIPLKATVNKACEGSGNVRKVLVYRRTGADIAWDSGRDIWWHDALKNDVHEAEEVDAEHPLFILYTSGSTGRPKGLVHSCGGIHNLRFLHPRDSL